MINILKNNSIIVKIMLLILVIPFYYITKGNDLFLYTINFILYLMLVNLFNHIDFSNYFNKYAKLKYKNINKKIVKYGLSGVIIFNLILSIIILIFSYYLTNVFMIKGMVLVSLIMSLSLFADPFVKIINDYLKNNNYLRLSKYLYDIYYVLYIVIFLLESIILFKLLEFNNYINIALLFIPKILLGILVLILYLIIIKREKNKDKLLTRNETKVNVLSIVKNTFSTNIITSFISIITIGYFYISIVFCYFLFMYRYGYTYLDTSNIINLTYFYGINIMLIIYVVINYIISPKLMIIINNIKNNIYDNLTKNITNYLNYVLKLSLPIIIVISILSGPIWFILFNNLKGTVILLTLVFLCMILILFTIINQLVINIKNKKLVVVMLIIGIIFKTIVTIPLIDSFYRMGYNLIIGDILSTVIGLLISIIIGLIILNRLYKVNLFKNFEELLKTIYTNIILCFILVIIQLIIPINTASILESVKTIIIYVIITIIFMIINKKIQIRH